MREREEAFQRMLDYIEEHVAESPTLLEMSRQIGYSPWYCSTQFHRMTGQTVKRYVAGRRLAMATLALRDTDKRILDIAVECGYSSQEALTRAFAAAFRQTPNAYRKCPRPVPLPIRRNVLFPQNEGEGESTMQKTLLTEPNVRVEYIPAHKIIGIWDPDVSAYMEFWDRHDCDAVLGVIDSMGHVEDPVVTCHTAGWYEKPDGSRGYLYGLGVPEDYQGEIPEGFSVREVPGSYYLVFYHPAFDFQKDCEAVMGRVERMAWGYDPAQMRFAWREGLHTYQRHMPETVGYEVLRPVERK